jgi:CO/xanthine dehydrogenase Mo-binding subunit
MHRQGRDHAKSQHQWTEYVRRGVACVSSQERATASWTACVAHVAVAPSGEVKVKKLTVATDVGTQVHPDNIRA